jgi:hypothetical protein
MGRLAAMSVQGAQVGSITFFSHLAKIRPQPKRGFDPVGAIAFWPLQ